MKIFIAGAFLIFVSATPGFIGMWGISSNWKKQAIAAGHAEYVMDPITGDVTWRWKDCCTTETAKVPWYRNDWMKPLTIQIPKLEEKE